jgi:holliday junction DNA helicase RuvA
MIAYLQGTILEVLEQSLILQAGDIGYELYLSGPTLQLASKGAQAQYYIHHHVREDQQKLYAFMSLQERDLFQKMISVNGIGPKSALGAIAAAEVSALISAIQLEDHSIFQSVSGIGPKTAKRLVMDLRGKVEWNEYTALASGPVSVQTELMQALEGLGYKQDEIRPMLAEHDFVDMTIDEALKLVLQKRS